MTKSRSAERRRGNRVEFERAISAQMMAIDGTWRRECSIDDISTSGAKLRIEGSIQGLNLKEFFLLLSSTGLAYRRCELIWINGDQLGASFLTIAPSKKGKSKGNPAAAHAMRETC